MLIRMVFPVQKIAAIVCFYAPQTHVKVHSKRVCFCGVAGCRGTVNRWKDKSYTFTDKAFDVEVLVLNSERLPFAGLPTVLTGDRSPSPSALLLLLLLLQRAVDSLLMKHCKRQTETDDKFRLYSST